MSKFYEEYKARLKALKEDYDRQVIEGVLSKEDADSLYWRVQDEILDAIFEK